MTRETPDIVRSTASTIGTLIHYVSQEVDNLLLPDADEETRCKIARIADLLGALRAAAGQLREEIGQLLEELQQLDLLLEQLDPQRGSPTTQS